MRAGDHLQRDVPLLIAEENANIRAAKQFGNCARKHARQATAVPARRNLLNALQNGLHDLVFSQLPFGQKSTNP